MQRKTVELSLLWFRLAVGREVAGGCEWDVWRRGAKSFRALEKEI